MLPASVEVTLTARRKLNARQFMEGGSGAAIDAEGKLAGTSWRVFDSYTTEVEDSSGDDSDYYLLVTLV
jgi:hypothetical protein